ncbi:MAG: DUF4388 domain-containing protein [Cyanobacteria bacterium P01_F01_bin.150]
MEITGTFAEFPLPELLQFLGKRHSTGCLSLEIFSNYYPELEPQTYIIWLNQGDIVLAQRRYHHQDIYALAIQKEWVSQFAARKLKARSPRDTAAGLYLETQGVLHFGQLRELFAESVVHRVEGLCSSKKAIFKFQTTNDLPMDDMTGLSISAIKLAQQGFQKTKLIGLNPLKGSQLNPFQLMNHS